ncbi:MAG: RecX family transcriptional regulator [Dehalococcoidia bacterium]|nr:RecX family transcriptional regulator [Dehalococcoidia bacterium]
MRTHLHTAGFDDEVVEETLASLTAQGFIDDHEFAAAWAESRMTFRPRSKRLIAKELIDRGVDETAADNATEDIDDESTATALALRRAGMLQDVDKEVFMRRLTRYLASRGYDYGTIGRAVRAAWAQKPDS